MCLYELNRKFDDERNFKTIFKFIKFAASFRDQETQLDIKFSPGQIKYLERKSVYFNYKTETKNILPI